MLDKFMEDWEGWADYDKKLKELWDSEILNRHWQVVFNGDTYSVAVIYKNQCVPLLITADEIVAEYVVRIHNKLVTNPKSDGIKYVVKTVKLNNEYDDILSGKPFRVIEETDETYILDLSEYGIDPLPVSKQFFKVQNA